MGSEVANNARANGVTVSFTGHSLGGALALLWQISRCYEFTAVWAP
ncbi:MAG: hypothetical protein CVT75_10080 [Alphaproteobacteria bacterium HGW-Alphaproteobacteria-14]|nr:MAG: hypothetical protein CVT75_10080 [Alphaproteobacteria bacterium HGW-Alphaproteobacteria-14]